MQCHVECDGPQATGTLEFGTPELELETQNQNSVLLLVSVKIGKDCNFFFCSISLEHFGVLVPYFCYRISTLSTLLEISLSLDLCYKECLLKQITCRLLICYKLKIDGISMAVVPHIW
jgi:hypothetical protein